MSTPWLTPPKRARKWMRSLVISNCVTARAAMLSTTLPSFAAPGGTRTVGFVASTRMYGVRPMSRILQRRSQYAWNEMASESRSEQFLFRRQTARESLAPEDALAVIDDHVR